MNDTITAYHGSPHDFEQFDTSKIGTGEGAQAYGHGLYFAEHEPTAQYYRDTLAHRGQIDLEHEANKLNMPMSREAMIEVRRHASGNYDPSEAAKHMHWSSVEARQYPQEKLANLIDIYRKAKQGNMYEVAIDAHPDHFLDWDEPLSKQPHITSKVMTPELINQINRYRAGWKLGDVKPDFSNLTGEDLYSHLSQPVSGQKGSDKAASEHLSNLGVHGIRYLDAMSRRHDKNATHNYVVFDHNRVTVKRKYEDGGRVAYKDGGKIGMGKTTLQPHALLHSDEDPSKIGLISDKTMKISKDLPKSGTIYWSKPIKDQEDMVQSTIKHRLSDFNVD